MRRLQQHLRSAFFVCEPHTDPTMMEVIFFQLLADGSCAPMPHSGFCFVAREALLRVPLVLRARRCSACRWPSPRSALRRRMAGVAREALLRMPLAVATKRAAQAHETWD